MKRKPPLNLQDIARTIRNLNVMGWLELEPSKSLPLPHAVLVDEFELAEV
jgi:hypothetical protein